ncbi:MAG: phage holin family protein [Opitutaceae bacterium]
MAEAEQGGGGVLDSARRITSSVLGLLHNRLSLAAVELQEEKLRAINLLLWLCAAIVLGAAGLMVVIAALGLFLWERAGYAGLVGLALAALAGGFVVLWLLRRRILRGPQPFATIVAEFGKDLECLRPRQ